MYLEERVPLYLEELEEKYYCDDLDFHKCIKTKRKSCTRVLRGK